MVLRELGGDGGGGHICVTVLTLQGICANASGDEDISSVLREGGG